MPWLLRDGKVLASLEVAATRSERRRGLLGRDGIEGALLIEDTKSVHTFGMQFPIDVAHLGPGGEVLRVTTMPQRRIGLPVWRARQVLEAEAGAFRHWELQPGQVLEIEQ